MLITEKKNDNKFVFIYSKNDMYASTCQLATVLN